VRFPRGAWFPSSNSMPTDAGKSMCYLLPLERQHSTAASGGWLDAKTWKRRDAEIEGAGKLL
jgi:hypothetical protein